MTSIGFGRVVVDGTAIDDPYEARIEDLESFEVISDGGPTYHVHMSGGLHWKVQRIQPIPSPVGTIYRGGNALNRWYSFTRHRRLFAAGQQNMFINAVFSLIGVDGDLR